MKDYILLRLDCTPCSEDITDLLADSMAEVGFESFEADEKGVSAYIAADSYDRVAAARVVAEFPYEVGIRVSEEIIEGRDWNEEWEKNYFKPIRVGDRCAVRSSFHEPTGAEIEIVVDPRMAFGTGHHATTSQMMSYLLDLPMEGKKVIDMGTGTGILSILATKLGAPEAIGIEIDPSAADNARDNCRLNDSPAKILTGDAAMLEGLEQADLFIANINRNIILADLSRYVKAMKPGGILLLSGFYTEDIPLIEAAAKRLGLTLTETRSEENWAALLLILRG